MRVLITGAAGMIGRKLTARLMADGVIADQRISSLVLHDIVEPPKPDGALETTTLCSDIADPDTASGLIRHRPDMIFHLAGVVSGEAERDFEKGYRANLDGTRMLFEAIRAVPSYHPKLVFTSSIAVFGAPFPEVIGDDFAPVPLTSYGVQKLACEHLLNDYSRRGIFDGIGLRLPTICVRPGKPNAAASGFFSSIIREPLAGRRTVLPVSRDVVHTHASPRAAINFLIHAAALDTARLGPRRNLSLPGVGVAVEEQLAALVRHAGNDVLKLIEEKPDPEIMAIVSNWPTRFAPERAIALGFAAETSFDEIIRAHVEDELGQASG